MKPTLATYLTYSEITGTPRTTIEEFRTELAKFECGPVIYTCSLINTLTTDWQGHSRSEAIEVLAKESLPPKIAHFVLAKLGDPREPRGLYHRQQLLFVSKEAASVCRESGGRDPVSLPLWGGLGIVLLMANDLLPKGLAGQFPAAQQMIRVLSELIPVAEASGFYRPINKIIRCYLMLDRFFPGNIDEAIEVFHKATRVPLNQYQALCFAALCRYFDMNIEKYRANPQDFLLTRDWFRTVSLPTDAIDAFLQDISASATELRALLLTKNTGTGDFTCFKERPLFRDKEVCFLTDAAYLAEKGESGTFWTINNALPRDRRLQFHRDWGVAFERYINWLIGESVDECNNKFYPFPKFADNGDEVCDAILICGDSALFIESKGTTFTARAKYGNDPETLSKELEDKLVQTTDQKKGVTQLATHIEDTFRRKAPREIDGLDLTRVLKVFPVLVMRDDVGAALVMNAYLASRFRETFHRKTVAVTVTPLFCFSAQDIELICGYLKEASFADLVEERYRNDPGQLSSFWTVPNKIIDKIGERTCEPFSAAFKRYNQAVQETLFAKHT